MSTVLPFTIHTMLKPYRCSHCKKRLVVLETIKGSFLPVEIPEGEIKIKAEDEFDGKIHTSHLKNCPPLAAEWEKKKKKFIDRNNPFAFLNYKELNK